jgi:hypothetical protein
MSVEPWRANVFKRCPVGRSRTSRSVVLGYREWKWVVGRSVEETELWGEVWKELSCGAKCGRNWPSWVVGRSVEGTGPAELWGEVWNELSCGAKCARNWVVGRSVEGTELWGEVWKELAQLTCRAKCGRNWVVGRSVEETELWGEVWKELSCGAKCGRNWPSWGLGWSVEKTGPGSTAKKVAAISVLNSRSQYCKLLLDGKCRPLVKKNSYWHKNFSFFHFQSTFFNLPNPCSPSEQPTAADNAADFNWI